MENGQFSKQKSKNFWLKRESPTIPGSYTFDCTPLIKKNSNFLITTIYPVNTASIQFSTLARGIHQLDSHDLQIQ